MNDSGMVEQVLSMPQVVFTRHKEYNKSETVHDLSNDYIYASYKL